MMTNVNHSVASRGDAPLAVLVVAVAVNVMVVHPIAHTCGPVGTVPISQLKRKASGWDVPAPGYEQYSAMQANQTGAHRLRMCLLFWPSPAVRRQCLCPHSAWVWQ
jgi:hypothetical protein